MCLCPVPVSMCPFLFMCHRPFIRSVRPLCVSVTQIEEHMRDLLTKDVPYGAQVEFAVEKYSAGTQHGNATTKDNKGQQQRQRQRHDTQHEAVSQPLALDISKRRRTMNQELMSDFSFWSSVINVLDSSSSFSFDISRLESP